MLIPFGILSAASGVEPFESDYELIATEILGSTEASVTFDVSSLGSTYKHLQVRLVARASGSLTGARDLFIRFNGDTGSNYTSHNLRGTGSAVQSNSLTSRTNILNESTFVNNNEAANIFGLAVIDILDPFSTTKNTTTRSLGGFNGSTSRLYLGSGVFRSTAAITSVNIGPAIDSILADSRFSIYGIK